MEKLEIPATIPNYQPYTDCQQEILNKSKENGIEILIENLKMFNKVCYDANLVDDKLNLKLGACYIAEHISEYKKIYGRVNDIINSKEVIQNNDVIYLSGNIATRLVPFKLENYCCERDIIIRKIETSPEDANVLICDPMESLSIIENGMNQVVTLIPLSEVKNNITVGRTDYDNQMYEINWEKDYIILNDPLAEIIIETLKPKNYFRDNFMIKWKEYTTPLEDNDPDYKAFMHFYNSNKRIIYIENLINDMHKDSAVLDEQMTDNIIEMMAGNDANIMNMAATMVCNCSRNGSVPYMIVIYLKYKHLFAYSTDSNFREFSAFIEKLNFQYSSAKNAIRAYSDEKTAEYLLDKYYFTSPKFTK
jgi:hypothetical protein